MPVKWSSREVVATVSNDERMKEGNKDEDISINERDGDKSDFVFVNATESEETSNEKFEQDQLNRVSLNAVYGRIISFWQVISVLVNTGMMMYAHLGVSAVFFSNVQGLQTSNHVNAANNNAANGTSSNLTGACTMEDINLWVNGADVNKSNDAIYCGYSYNHAGCGLNEVCNTECFHSYVGYTVDCATCSAKGVTCLYQAGCFSCLPGGNKSTCLICSAECTVEFYKCSGLPMSTVDQIETSTASPQRNSKTNGTATASTVNSLGSTSDVCVVDTSAIDTYFQVYELSFFPAVKQAWTSNAKLLVAIVVLFSGVWPYAKNAILLLAWFVPLRPRKRAALLTTLRRLGKYSFVDLFVSFCFRENRCFSLL